MDNQNYFELRNVSPETYLNSRIPPYLNDIISNLHTDSKILDYGCGFGQLIESLHKAGFKNTHGADIDAEALKYLKSLNLIVHDLRHDSSFSSMIAQYDLIIMSHVLEHIPKADMIATLSHIRRLLSATGKLVVVVPNAQSNTGCYWAYEDFTHHTIFTSGSIMYVLKASGFTNLQFIDPYCVAGLSPLASFVRKVFLNLYRLNIAFWNKITSSSLHKPSLPIYSYEIKVLASI